MIMRIVEHITKKYHNISELKTEYESRPPWPNIELKDFIPIETIRAMKDECNRLNWDKKFTRKGSHMLEKIGVDDCPVARETVNQLHSATFLNWLSELTGHYDLIVDPYLIGAGYMRCFNGDSLKIHTDFNWNDTLKCHRMISLIFYLNEDWREEWNGDLQLWDFKNTKCLQKIYPTAGNAIIYRYHNLGFHGHPNPIDCPKGITRDGFRIFYYVAKQAFSPDDRPHRSLYWYDKEQGKPYDIYNEK
jgi:hypothetical protein